MTERTTTPQFKSDEELMRTDIQRLFEGQTVVKDMLSKLREDISRLAVLVGTMKESIDTNRMSIRDMNAENDAIREKRSDACLARFSDCARQFKIFGDWMVAKDAQERAAEHMRAKARVYTSLWIGGLYTMATIGLLIIGYLALGR